MPKAPDDWTGIYPHGAGWRACVSQGRGRPPLTRHFPTDTPLRVMQDWRDDMKALHRVQRKQRAFAGSFEHDAKRYLRAVTGLPTYTDRAREIRLWITEFGVRRRETIRPADIREIRDRWAREPRAPKQPPLAAGTINKRLRALSNLWTVLDGKRAPNPVRDVPELPEPDAQPRALRYEDIDQIVAQLSTKGRAEPGKKRPDFATTTIRLRCLAYCQITPKQLSQLQPQDLDLERGRIRLPARTKGRGAAAVWVPLSPKALDAFTEFHNRHLYGTFYQRALSRAWKRAVKRAGLSPSRPYDARHSYATAVYRATRSRDAVQQLLQHASWETSARYAMDAEADVLNAHAVSVVRHIGATASGVESESLENRGAAAPASVAPSESAKTPEPAK